MKCEEYRILIEDYIDGVVDERASARVNAHTASCVECASFYQQISREQELYSRYQREVEASPALWTSIESRIKLERASRPAGLMARLREQLAAAFAGPRLSPGFAAALVIIAIGITVFVMSRLNAREQASLQAGGNGNAAVEPSVPTPAPQQQPAPAVTPDRQIAQGGPSTTGAQSNPSPRVNAPRKQLATTLTPAQLVREAEQKYLTAIAMLSRDVDRRRSQLDPMMLARFDASLSEIDRTIRETRQVVKGNPDDPIALQYLLAAYSKKVDVLREMAND